MDWMVLGTPPGFADALGGLQSPAWADVREGLTSMWLDGLDIPALTAYVASMKSYGQRHWSRAGREIAASSPPSPYRWQDLEELQPCPTLHLYASRPPTRCWPRSRSTPRPTRGSPSGGSSAQPLPDVRGARGHGRGDRVLRTPVLIIGTSPPRTLLVAVAHPDDETFGCGSLLMHAAAAASARSSSSDPRRGGRGRERRTGPAGGVGGSARRAAGGGRRPRVAEVEVLFADSGLTGPPPA